MSKYQLRIEARELRTQGLSIKKIASKLGIAKSTTSFWVSNIILTENQLTALKESASMGREIGRLKCIQIQKNKRLVRLEEAKRLGRERISLLSSNEFFLSGLSLYWAEGGKSYNNKRVEFCNSDPRMIKFLTLWLKQCFNIRDEDLKAIVGINYIHNKREEIVKKYWSEVAGIPLKQFRKTSFKKVENKKVYDNFNEHFGTLSVVVAKSTNLFFEIIGLIEALSLAKINKMAT